MHGVVKRPTSAPLELGVGLAAVELQQLGFMHIAVVRSDMNRIAGTPSRRNKHRYLLNLMNGSFWWTEIP